jgi:predicted membrane channel-forming protein YqfA (hemolysin III family)
MGWQCAIVSITFLAGTIIQGLIVLNNPHYVFERWHGTLLVIAITLFSILFNTFLAKRLPLVEVFILILHICGLFCHRHSSLGARSSQDREAGIH